MDRVQKASEACLRVAHLAVRSTGRGVVPRIVKQKHSYAVCARSVDTLLLVLFWHIRFANASTCPEGTYRESVKLKGILAENQRGCSSMALGTYLEHDDPAEYNSHRVYKLQNTTDDFFLWWQNGRYFGSDEIGSRYVRIQTPTNDLDISSLVNWYQWCMDKSSREYFTNVMTISIDSVVCSQCPANSASSPGSTSIAACRCNAGYTGEGSCTACAPGTFKTQTGIAISSNCAADWTSAADNISPSPSTCQCPSNTAQRVKLKARLAPSPSNCLEQLSGTYLQHDNPPEISGAPVYKLQNVFPHQQLATVYIWWRQIANRYVISAAAGDNTKGYYFQAASSDKDIKKLTSWHVYCSNTKTWIYLPNIMTVSVDSISCPDANAVVDHCDTCDAGKYAPVAGSISCASCGNSTVEESEGCLVTQTKFQVQPNNVTTATMYHGPGNILWFEIALETISLRAMLHSARRHWPVGTEVRIGSALGEPPLLNPAVLRRIAVGEHERWTPANVNPMHTTNSTRYYANGGRPARAQ